MIRQFFLCAGLVAAGVLASMCLAQEDPARPTPAPAGLPAAPPEAMAPRVDPIRELHEIDLNEYLPHALGRAAGLFAVSDPEWATVEKLKDELGEAKDDKQKTALTDKLKGAVDKCFENDMKTRETELTRLQQRLDKLRAQLERRRKAKDEIVQLEVKVLANEAAGLGFSTSPASKVRRTIRKRTGGSGFDRGANVFDLEVRP